MFHLTTVCIALASLSSVASAQEKGLEMGAVFAANPQLSTMAKLFAVDPNLFDASQDPVDTTFLAPTDEAFKEFLRVTRGASDFMENKATRFRVFKDLMNYHTLRGSYKIKELHEEDTKILRTRLENSTYVQLENINQVARVIQENSTDYIYGGYNERISIVKPTDMELWNGYIHAVDGFLKPPGPLFSTADELNMDSWIQACAETNTTKEFAALEEVTIFMPSNVKLPTDYSISAADILRYHIVKGKVLYSNALQKSVTKVDSFQGGRLIITRKGDDLYVNDAKVIMEDIIIDAGVIHVIQNTLDPLGNNFKSTKKDNACTCTDGNCVDSKGKPCTLEPKLAAAKTAPGFKKGFGKTTPNFNAVSAGVNDDSRKNIVKLGTLSAVAAVFIYIFS